MKKDPLKDLPALRREFLALGSRAPLTVLDLLRFGTSLFGRARIDVRTGGGTFAREAELLARFRLGLPPELGPYHAAKLTPTELKEVLDLFEERIRSRLSAPYLIREAPYFGRVFYVDQRVIIPRSLLAPYFDKILAEVVWENNRVLDLCTGSGCIGISLALRREELEVDLADVSKDALDVAKINVERYKLGHRVRLLHGDLFEKVRGPYSLIISNPPYLNEEEMGTVPEEIRNEPMVALTGGRGGVELVDRILEEAPRHLTPRGTLAVETGAPAARLLAKRWLAIPFKWWHNDAIKLTGFFTLTNGYPVPSSLKAERRPAGGAGSEAARAGAPTTI